MDDLVQWLRAQLDEDEQVARAAYAPNWSTDGQRGVYYGIEDEWMTDALTTADADHIAAWDPARVLREIDANRALVDAYAQACRKRTGIADEHWGAPGPSGDLSAVERWKEHDAVAETLKPHVLRRAAVYADRPGYREEWRP